LHPFLEAAFEDAPLPADFEGRYLAVLNHPVQRPFGNLEDVRGFREGEKLDRRVGFLHLYFTPRVSDKRASDMPLSSRFITDQIKSNFADCARYRPGCVGQKSTVSNSRRQKWRHRQFCTLWKSSRGKSAVPASVCRAQQILARGFLFAGEFKFAFEPGENPMTRVGQALANAQGGAVF